MSRDLLLEIGVEEMPSAFMNQALADLKQIAAQRLTEHRLAFGEIKSMGTPRRLVLLVNGLAESQEDAVIETKGPKKSAAFDKDGQPTKAVQGFARGQGVDVGLLQVQEVAGIEYVFAVKKEIGGPSQALLPSILQDIINSLTFPKSMRWGYFQTRFARPIRWLLAIFGTEPISMQIENVSSANITYGHRFLAPEPVKVNTIPDYFTILSERYVIVDHNQRKQLVWQQVQAVADRLGGKVVENDDLLNEVNFLLEYPTAFYGEYSSAYLAVPPEVLTTSMIEHQRYFPVFDQGSQLLNFFIGVRNGTDYSLDLVKAGNERVIKARLEDALFFWNEDLKKGLAAMVPGLQNVMFHERLGSVLEKVERLQALAAFISREYKWGDPVQVDRAAYLCKADLLSSMVYEFPELQGIMGRYYALATKEDQAVAEAIFEHYLPRFAGDKLPASENGIVLSLAEKIYNLTAFFAIGIRPSGSQDPYSLRRQALGVVNIISELGLKISLPRVISQAYQSLATVKPEKSENETVSELIEFILQRLRGVMLDRGISYDVVDAVLAQGDVSINQIVLKAEAVSSFKDNPRWEDFMVVFNRSNNLSKKWDSTQVNEIALIDPSEKQLYEHYLNLQSQVETAVGEMRYIEGMEIMAGIRPDLDRFFDAVMVMVDDQELRASRLGVLKAVANLCCRVADFSKIVS